MILRIAREKVGHRQGPIKTNAQPPSRLGVCVCGAAVQADEARGTAISRRASFRPPAQGDSYRHRTRVRRKRSSPLWERLRVSRPLKGGFLFGIVASSRSPRPEPRARSRRWPTPSGSLSTADAVAAASAPAPDRRRLVLIGIDDDTEERLPRADGAVAPAFRAASCTRWPRRSPRAVGVDVVPPERSFDSICRASTSR